MADILTNEDKMAIANSHKRSLESDKYNLELSIHANAESPVNAESVSAINARLTGLNAKRTVLAAEAAQFSE